MAALTGPGGTPSDNPRAMPATMLDRSDIAT
jgi:hypothetical protein